MTEMKRRGRGDEGIAFVLAAVSMVALLIMVAFAVDLGNARQIKRQAQATADAAALAGAGTLREGGSDAEVAATVKLYATRNFDVPVADWAGCDSTTSLPMGWRAAEAGNNCILIDQSDTRVWVTKLPAREVSTFFAQIAGNDMFEISAAAAAEIRPGGAGECGFCVLGPFDAQNGDITVSGDAGAAINGSAQTGRNGILTVSGGSIVVHNNGTWAGNFSPTPVSVPDALADPLAFLAEPTITGGLKSGCGQGPGVYEQLPRNCTLDPGLYVVVAPNHPSGQSNINATTGTTIYFTCRSGSSARACNPNEAGGEMVCTGQASFDVVAQQRGSTPVGGAIPGVAIFFDRNNTGSLDCRGNGGSGVVGTIYGRSATLRMRGNGECTFDRSLVVVGEVDFSGNPSNCSVTYNMNENVELQGSVSLLE